MMTRLDHSESATWTDLKQFGWGLLVVTPLVGVFAWGARVLVGGRTALWLGIGLFGVAIVAYGSVVAACLLVSYGADAVRVLRRALGRRQVPRVRNGHILR